MCVSSATSRGTGLGTVQMQALPGVGDMEGVVAAAAAAGCATSAISPGTGRATAQTSRQGVAVAAMREGVMVVGVEGMGEGVEVGQQAAAAVCVTSVTSRGTGLVTAPTSRLLVGAVGMVVGVAGMVVGVGVTVVAAAVRRVGVGRLGCVTSATSPVTGRGIAPTSRQGAVAEGTGVGAMEVVVGAVVAVVFVSSATRLATGLAGAQTLRAWQ
jgi:hypothetical protein